MSKIIRKSIFARLRNYFFAGAVVLIPIGITIYLTLFIVKISSSILPKGINPNHYLINDIPGIEILITIVFITVVGWLSLSFLGKKGKLNELFLAFKEVPNENKKDFGQAD